MNLLYERTDSQITEQKHYLNDKNEEVFTADPITNVTTNPYIAPDKPSWDFVKIVANNGDTTEDPVYPVPSNVTHIDVYYKKGSKKIILYAQDLSRNYEVKNLVLGDRLFNVYDKADQVPEEHRKTHNIDYPCHTRRHHDYRWQWISDETEQLCCWFHQME